MRIDRYAYASRLRDFYPNARIAAGLLPLLFCISLNAYSAALLVIFVLGLASIVCCARTRRRAMRPPKVATNGVTKIESAVTSSM